MPSSAGWPRIYLLTVALADPLSVPTAATLLWLCHLILLFPPQIFVELQWFPQ